MRSLAKSLSFAFVALATIFAAGCATTVLPAGSAQITPGEVPEYLLGAGDRVRVTVFGEEELSGEFLISSRGMVALPLIGEVEAGGQTLEAFQKIIEAKLVATDMIRAPTGGI